MNCKDFLALHTEWLDDVLEPVQADGLRDHALGCASCARYDTVVRRGLELARAMLPVVEVSPDFEARVRHRLYHEREASARRRNAATSVYVIAASVILVTAAAGALAIMDSRTPVVDAPALFAAAPPAMSEIGEKRFVAGDATVASLSGGAEDAVAPIESEAKGHDVHVASTSGWPVYSRGAVAIAFPAARNEAPVRPADFRASAAIMAPLLIRY